MKVAITGHRPNKLGNDYDLTGPLILKIKAEIEKTLDLLKPDTLISGMALGIDTLFAKVAIEKDIPLIAAIPCLNQSKMWPERSKKVYAKILESYLTDEVYVTKAPYTNSCMQRRNIYMVDNCDVLIAVWDGSPGGTANCVVYAQGQDKNIIFINPNKL